MTAATTTADRNLVTRLFANAGIDVPADEIDTYVEIYRGQCEASALLADLQPEIRYLDWVLRFSPRG